MAILDHKKLWQCELYIIYDKNNLAKKLLVQIRNILYLFNKIFLFLKLMVAGLPLARDQMIY